MTSYSDQCEAGIVACIRQEKIHFHSGRFRWWWAWVLCNLLWGWEQLSESGFEDSFWLLVAVVSQTISWVICLAACLHYRPRKVSAPCRCGSESKFMTSHVPRPAHKTSHIQYTIPWQPLVSKPVPSESGSDTIDNRHASRPRPTNGFDSVYTWGRSAPVQTQFNGVWRSGLG